MFLDASAVVAILAGEDDSDVLLDRIDAATTTLHTSPVAMMESVLGLRRARGISIHDAEMLVHEFMSALRVRQIPITPEIGVHALRAYERYGKPNPARLNMGDCFAYGCAKGHDLPLLYKGDDFSRTDRG